jgi:4-methyl-5(b-hydroxyethyl)-thiazole monophosphate biosynthesis
MPHALVGDLDLDSFDALAIPGGFARSGFYDDALSEEFTTIIAKFAAADKPVASVCVASLSLGAAGILRGRRATIYHQVGGKRKAQLEGYGAVFVDQPVVVEHDIITSTGPGTAIEVAFALLERLTSRANAEHIRRLMRMPDPAPGWSAKAQV